MRDRIKQFMDFKGLSASDLSAVLDVQRSNVSHILNGRNLPGAAFIEKLLMAFPELNARWLFLGTGTMLNEATPERPVAAKAEGVQQEKPAKPTAGAEKLPAEIPVQSMFKEVKVETGLKMPQVRKVEKIVVLYTDKTFSEYNPE